MEQFFRYIIYQTFCLLMRWWRCTLSTVYCDYLYLNQGFIVTTCIRINSLLWLPVFESTVLLWLSVFESTVYCDYLYLNQQFCDYLYLNQQFYCDYLYLNQQFIVTICIWIHSFVTTCIWINSLLWLPVFVSVLRPHFLTQSYFNYLWLS